MLLRVVVLLLTLPALLCLVSNLHQNNFYKKINQSPFTFVYFYSSSCGYCKQFTPKFQQISKDQSLLTQGIAFAKIDAAAYSNFSQNLKVFSYPTLALFWKDIETPIYYYRQRDTVNMTNFLNKMIKPTHDQQVLTYIHKLTPVQQKWQRVAIFYGTVDSPEYKLWDFIAKRDGYIAWAQVQSDRPRVQVANVTIQLEGGIQSIQSKVQAALAHLQGITQDSWLRMVEKKKFTIAYINKHSNKKTRALLAQLAEEITTAHFVQINGQHEQYKHALKFLQIPDQQNIFSVDKAYDVLYQAQPPYSHQSLRTFIQKARNHNLTAYRKSQKTQKPNKLTRQNYAQRMSTSQDVLLFLYNRKQKISKQLMKLFEYLVWKLRQNKNLLLLRCDVGMNEIEEKLQFIIKPTPKVVFFRNRMKDKPIHFTGKTISGESVTQFIMENTTYDFEEEWEWIVE